MSDELNQFKEEVTESVTKLVSVPRIRAAFNAAGSTGWKAGLAAVGVGLLIKPLFLAAAVGAIGYTAYSGYKAYRDFDGGDKPPAPPKDFNLG